MDLSVPERLYISSMVTIVVLPCKYKSFHPAKEKYHEKHTYFSFPAAPVVALRASQQPSQPAGRHTPEVVHVRTDVVVESDNPAYCHFRLADRCRTLHPVEPFLLYYAVHAFGHGVVRRVVVLGHAYAYACGAQHVCVFRAAVLRPTVRVVDESVHAETADRVDGLPQGRHRVGGLQRVGQPPAYYFVREGVRKQVQVSNALVCVHVRDVCHPQPVHALGAEALDQVRILSPRVVGVCRVAPAAWLEHQPALVHEAVEGVAATKPLTVNVLQDEEQLVGSYAGGLAAEITDTPDYFRLGKLTGRALLARHRIITLACLAKQSAQAPYGNSRVPGPKVVYCLAPAFFSRSMPYFSLLIFIISLSASLRSSE